MIGATRYIHTHRRERQNAGNRYDQNENRRSAQGSSTPKRNAQSAQSAQGNQTNVRYTTEQVCDKGIIAALGLPDEGEKAAVIAAIEAVQ